MSLTSRKLITVNQPFFDDDERDMTDLLVEAEEGNPQAQFECGMMLILGMGLRQDAAAGVNLLVEAAMAGHAKARAEMECCYLFGENPVSIRTEEWLALAAKQDDPSAFDYYLGYYHHMGILVERSDERAAACLLRAVKLGNASAQEQLGRLERIGRKFDYPAKPFASQTNQRCKKLFAPLSQNYG